MIINKNRPSEQIPLYEVEELSMEEAWRVIAADKRFLEVQAFAPDSSALKDRSREQRSNSLNA